MPNDSSARSARGTTTSLRKFLWEGRVPEELAKQAKDGVLTLDQFKEYYRKNHDYLSLESGSSCWIAPWRMRRRRRPQDAKLQAAPTLVYLANTITTESVELGAFVAALDPAPLSVDLRDDTPAFFRIPYSVVAAVPPEKPAPVASPFHPAFTHAKLPDDAVVLANWNQSPLRLHGHDRVIIQYFDPERHGNLEQRSALFRLGNAPGAHPAPTPFLPLDIHADPDLTPTFPGITDKLDLRTWDPPFPYDNRRVKPRDEEYWKRYRTTPKAYVSLAAGQELWTSRFGRLTSVRLAIPPDRSAKEARDDFEHALLTRLSPEQGGLVFNPIRAEALKASNEGTDFGGLFLGFSFFLIAAALLLVGLLTRLSLDRRAAEAGLLFAVGYRRRTVRRLLLVEGTILAAIGALVGCVAAVGYAWLMLELLRFLWPGGLAQSFLRLHVTPMSFGIGYGAAVGVSVGTIFWAVRALGKASPTLLLQGEVRVRRAGRERPTGAAGFRLRARAGGRGRARLPLRRAVCERPRDEGGPLFRRRLPAAGRRADGCVGVDEARAASAGARAWLAGAGPAGLPQRHAQPASQPPHRRAARRRRLSHRRRRFVSTKARCRLPRQVGRQRRLRHARRIGPADLR